MGFKYGDHIRVPRGLYYHHGIVAGADEVIHYLDEGVSLTSFDDFADGGEPERVKHKNHKYGRREVVRRAKSRLDEDEYNLVFDNCEHFCNWCLNGYSASGQVENFYPAIGLGLASVLVPGLAPLAAVAGIAGIAGTAEGVDICDEIIDVVLIKPLELVDDFLDLIL
ncbi:MAG: lecithin retinol acyltransferase family protein [Deltaproteobacteria bacterium]|nr:lecithin retinol acyltransferase family protein [Deltaproteobacteria bacterium]